MSKRTKIALLTIGLPAFITGVVVAVIMFEVPGTLMSAVSDDGIDPAPAAPQSPAASSTTTPVALEPSEPPEPPPMTRETDLLEDLSYVETSIEGQGRYVSLVDPSGLWSVGDPAVMARTSWGVWEPQKGLPFGGSSIRLAFHHSQLTHRCVHVEIDAHKPFEMQVTMNGRRKEVEVPSGISLIETVCTKSKPAGDTYNLNLSPIKPVPSGADPVVRGAWLVPNESVPSLDAPNRPQTCGTSGVSIEPGVTLFFRAIASSSDELTLEASGESATRLSLTLRGSPGAKKNLLEPAADGSVEANLSGTWPLELKHQRPIEVAATLGADADEPVCIEKLSLIHPMPQAAFDTSKMPEVKGVVVVLLDTLRYDTACTLNPNSPVLTPNLSALAQRSVVFNDATSHANYTKPAVGSILTGVYPHANGGLSHKGALHTDVPMVTEMLQDAGVQTAGLFSNRFLTEKFNFMRGWDTDMHVDAYKASLGGEIVSEGFVEFNETWKAQDRFFFWVHVMDPHAPYKPRNKQLEIKYVGHRVLTGRFTPRSTSTFITNLRRGKEKPPSPEELKDIYGLYRADVASMDLTLGEIVDTLEHEGLLDDTLLIVVSDHGEEFMEHGYLGHGTNIHPELTHIPMIVKFPGDAIVGEYDSLVGHIDLTPTILDALGQDVPPSLQGQSLISRLGEPQNPADPPAYLVEHWNGTYGIRLGHWMALGSRNSTSLARINKYKVWYQDAGRHPVLWIYMRERLALMVRESAHDVVELEEAVINTETKDQLEALGYILD